jgi:hypothetical protein
MAIDIIQQLTQLRPLGITHIRTQQLIPSTFELPNALHLGFNAHLVQNPTQEGTCGSGGDRHIIKDWFRSTIDSPQL